MTAAQLEPFFLEGGRGPLFALLRRTTASNRCAVFVPPFAEEMNCCRRQMTETATRLIEAGWSVLMPDLYGTGDSGGEFADASWECWVDDLARMYQWAADQGFDVDALVAARLGCILATHSLESSSTGVRTSVFWQPVDDGSQFLRQFLRLRVAQDRLRGNGETVDNLLQRLGSGETLEIGGYTLSAELASQIARASLTGDLAWELGNVAVFEIGRVSSTSDQRTAARLQETARQDGLQMRVFRLQGEPFWSVPEVAVNVNLARLTAEQIERTW